MRSQCHWSGCPRSRPGSYGRGICAWPGPLCWGTGCCRGCRGTWCRCRGGSCARRSCGRGDCTGWGRGRCSSCRCKSRWTWRSEHSACAALEPPGSQSCHSDSMGTPELVASSTTSTLPGTAPPQKRIASVCANETHPCVAMLPTCLSHLGPLQKGQGQWSRSCWQQLCGSWGAGRGRVCQRSWAGTWDTWAWGRKGQHPWGGVPPGCSGCAPHGCPGHPGWWTAGCTHRTSASPPEDKVRQSAVKELHTSLTASPPEDKVRQSTVKELHTSLTLVTASPPEDKVRQCTVKELHTSLTASPPEDKVRQSAVKELHTSRTASPPEDKVRQSAVKELHTSRTASPPEDKVRQSAVKELHTSLTASPPEDKVRQSAVKELHTSLTASPPEDKVRQSAVKELHTSHNSFFTWRHSQTERCQGATHIAQQLLHPRTKTEHSQGATHIAQQLLHSLTERCQGNTVQDVTLTVWKLSASSDVLPLQCTVASK